MPTPETYVWQPIEAVDEGAFTAMFASSTWVLAATSDGRVTEAMPYILDGGRRLWICSRGSNCSDPRWPTEYLPLFVTHWMPLPDAPESAS
jgi:hypothetical protein